MFARFCSASVAVFLLVIIFGPAQMRAQQSPQPNVFGIYVDSDATLRYREKDSQQQLSQIRSQAHAAAAKNENLHFVSLSKLFADARSLIEADKPLSDEIRFLGGLTQLHYILVYPE